MMRCARIATLWLVVILCAGAASAQTPAATPGPESPFYGELNFGPTFGHKSSGFFGGEVGYRVMEHLDVFIEGGRMGNVGTSDLDARAQVIANALGGTASASYKVNYFDAGVRYNFTQTPWPMVHPYAMLGLGVAQVTAETVITVNGAPVTSDTVTFGSDLNGTTRKLLFTLGGGVNVPFHERYFGDLSLRYGHISPKTADIPDDTGINTIRLQLAVGIRF